MKNRKMKKKEKKNTSKNMKMREKINRQHDYTSPTFVCSLFLVADTQLYKRLCPSVRPSVGWSVGRSVTLELKSGKTRISAPAHPSATDGRVSGLVFLFLVDGIGKPGGFEYRV